MGSFSFFHGQALYASLGIPALPNCFLMRFSDIVYPSKKLTNGLSLCALTMFSTTVYHAKRPDRNMAGDGGYAPPLCESKSHVLLLYESPINWSDVRELNPHQ